MRADVSDVLKVGDFVTLADGLYAGLDGEVVEVVHAVNPWVGRARLRLPGAGDDFWHPFWSDPMDEQLWLTTFDTAAMERYLDNHDPPWSHRKRLLYVCACVRRLWEMLPPWHRSIVEGVEADAEVDDRTRHVRWCATGEAFQGKPTLRYKAAMDAAEALLMQRRVPQAAPTSPPARYGFIRSRAWLASAHVFEADLQRDLLRCIAGNPFRPCPLSPDLLAWTHRLIPSLASQIYDGHRFDEMTILADALEDAGCTDDNVISHARSPLHSRGCWLLDAILGKS
jgi:hypothetical protein